MIGNLRVTAWKVITQKKNVFFYEKNDPGRNVKV
jgi:hypothetical protein